MGHPLGPPSLCMASLYRSGPSNYYELLGVHPGASAEEVKRAFFSKSKELHPDRDPGNPTLHSRFVELSEAYQVLSREQSRRAYDQQLRSGAPPRAPGSSSPPRSAHQAHSSWEPPNARYWAQFHGVRPQGPESRQQQHQHNLRVLRYCLLIMLAGMGLHYVAFRKLEQMHRSFMDEKDRIITAIYNETRARARSVPALACPLLPVPATSGTPTQLCRRSLLQGKQSQAQARAKAESAPAAITTICPRP
ncbi:DnaJ subfamily C member 4 [Galemys pyrenaicus]|uniref:DnaJ homolog subfamily C member 4 n=1 Tax=Galemys pyrenaicus TaxID=202257 RepID=A0A8J6BG03_GALPY|nr:DnaJ subfamily C member 4 [Galemys pyrenaicus]